MALRVAFRTAKWVDITVEGTDLLVANGQAGTLLTWQTPFPITTPCVACKRPARLALGGKEVGDGGIVYLHENTHRPDAEGKGGFWPHDAIAFCLYFCTEIDCAEATILWNQA